MKPRAVIGISLFFVGIALMGIGTYAMVKSSKKSNE
jgi:hypothetical protein